VAVHFRGKGPIGGRRKTPPAKFFIEERSCDARQWKLGFPQLAQLQVFDSVLWAEAVNNIGQTPNQLFAIMAIQRANFNYVE